MSAGRTWLPGVGLGLLLLWASHAQAWARVSMSVKRSGGFGKATAAQAKGLVKTGTAPPSRPPPTAQQQISRTNSAIAQTLQAVRAADPALAEALDLYKWLTLWDDQRRSMSILDLAAAKDGILSDAEERRARLDELMATHPDITQTRLHNTLQVVTWDAAAAGRAERHAHTELSSAGEDFVRRLVEAVTGGLESGVEARVLDVGCGDGVLYGFLKDALGAARMSGYVGIDLSPNMLREARARHAGARFLEADFMDFRHQHHEREHKGRQGFDAVVFNEVWHYLLSPEAALRQACGLLDTHNQQGKGRIVISHPKTQGSSNVRRQRSASPVLVPTSMPSTGELRAMVECLGLPLRVLTGDEEPQGSRYLVVLETTG